MRTLSGAEIAEPQIKTSVGEVSINLHLLSEADTIQLKHELDALVAESTEKANHPFKERYESVVGHVMPRFLKLLMVEKQGHTLVLKYRQAV